MTGARSRAKLLALAVTVVRRASPPLPGRRKGLLRAPRDRLAFGFRHQRHDPYHQVIGLRHVAGQELQGSAVGPQPICPDGLGSSVSPHRFFQKFQGRLAVTGLGDYAFQHLTLMVDGPTVVVSHSVDLHVDLVQVPSPLPAHAHAVYPLGLISAANIGPSRFHQKRTV